MIFPTNLPFMGISHRNNNPDVNAALKKLFNSKVDGNGDSDDSLFKRTMSIIGKLLYVMFFGVVSVAVIIVCNYVTMSSAPDTRQLSDATSKIYSGNTANRDRYSGNAKDNNGYEYKVMYCNKSIKNGCENPVTEMTCSCGFAAWCGNAGNTKICYRDCNRFDKGFWPEGEESQGDDELCGCENFYNAFCSATQVCTTWGPGFRYCKDLSQTSKPSTTTN